MCCGSVDVRFLSDGQAGPWRPLKGIDSSSKACICERQKVEGLAREAAPSGEKSWLES